MNKTLQRANHAPVTAELLGGALEAINEMAAEDRSDMTARLLRIIRYLDEQGVDERASILTAIEFRLEALARLSLDGDLKGFRHPSSENGAEWIHEDVVRCAAEIPLRARRHRLFFDRDEFHNHLLEIATPAGAA